MGKKVRVPLRISGLVLAKIDLMIRSHVFKDRSHYFCYVVARYLDGVDPVQDFKSFRDLGGVKEDRQIDVYIPQDLIEKVDKAVREYRYGSRSHALRACAIRHLVAMRLIGGGI